MADNYTWLLIFPVGILLLYLMDEKGEKVEVHTLVEKENSWLVKTQNYDAPDIDKDPIFKPTEYAQVRLGKINGKMIVKSWEYSKERYTEEDVRKLIKERLIGCKRCRKA